MSEFSSFERQVASFLTRFPGVKKNVKLTYSYLAYFINKPDSFFVSEKECEVIKYLDEESFFGYYDHSPLSSDGRKIIFNSTSNDTSKLPSRFSSINICVYDFESKKNIKLTDTRAFNWQQGSRLIWIDNDCFIFNDYDDKGGCYISQIYSLSENKVVRKLDRPIYDVKKNMAVSIDFRRFTELRPDYGYFAHKKDSFDLNSDPLLVETVDLITGEVCKIFDIEIFKKEVGEDYKEGTVHKFNHLMISPSGKKIMFIHRYYYNDVRSDRLVVYNFETKKIDLLTSKGIVSHCYWYDDENIYGYFTDHRGNAGYNKVCVTTKAIEKISDRLDGLGDGHPNLKHKKLLVSDTYPNKSRMKDLFIYNIDDDSKNTVASIFEPLNFFGETRCDLHPRFSDDAEYLFFDSVHSGKRQLYMMRTSL